MSHFPKEVVTQKNESEMRLELVNGSAIQLVGSDNIDSIMGTNPLGCVFSEYALQDPKAWDYMRPILRENGGWAIFDYTPRGKNHGFHLYQMAKSNPDWYAEILTVNDTKALTEQDIQAERDAGMSEELIQQEFYCSFQGVQQGSVFGHQMDLAEQEGRVCGVPWEPELAVSTWWDIGTGDATAIWFTQDVGREVHVIDYYENSGTGKGIDFYIKHLQSLPYIWGTHNGPHDIDQHQFAANGLSTREQADKLGFRFQRDTLKKEGQSTINATRSFMHRCYFDRLKTERGRLCLSSYRYLWDERRACFKDEPDHDWSSHGADAFQYLSIGHKWTLKLVKERQESETYTPGQEHTAWMG